LKIQITKRDVNLLLFLFRFKAVTFKQIEHYFFKRDTSTVSKRLTKLRKNGLVTVICKAPALNSSLIFGLTKSGLNQLLKLFPDLCLSERYKSHSIFHDVALVEIASALKSKSNVESYWTENTIQSSRSFADDDSLSLFRDFNFDGLVRFKTDSSGSFIFGLEYENSQKDSTRYKAKISQIYLESRPQAVLYVCNSSNIEKAIKKAELEIANNYPKKLFFIQYDEVTKGEKTLTFENQDSKRIVIK
jgi:hypothetical protein